MGNVGFSGGHMAIDTAIVFVPLQAQVRRKRAAFFSVAAQAAFPVVVYAFRSRGKLVRIVTRDTAHLAAAGNEAAAGMHLLHLADELPGLRLTCRPYKHGHEKVQRQTRAKVEHAPAAAQNADLSLKVTLLANRFAQGWLQVTRIDDGGIDDVGRLFTPLMAAYMQFAGAVAALAADGI